LGNKSVFYNQTVTWLPEAVNQNVVVAMKKKLLVSTF
jgi:hypothetical protein